MSLYQIILKKTKSEWHFHIFVYLDKIELDSGGLIGYFRSEFWFRFLVFSWKHVVKSSINRNCLCCHSITKIIASMYLLSLCQLSIKKEYLCVTRYKSNKIYKINPGLNQNYYKYLLISKCLSLYCHLNLNKITCSPDLTTNYYFRLNEWIYELSTNQNEFCFVYMLLLFCQNHIIGQLIREYLWKFVKTKFVICCWIWFNSLRINKCQLKVKEKVYYIWHSAIVQCALSHSGLLHALHSLSKCV